MPDRLAAQTTQPGFPMADPLSEAVEAAVRRAIGALLPDIVAAVTEAAQSQAPAPVQPGADRFVPFSECLRRLGMHRTTFYRHETEGRIAIPRRRRPGGDTGYFESELERLMASWPDARELRAARRKAG